MSETFDVLHLKPKLLPGTIMAPEYAEGLAAMHRMREAVVSQICRSFVIPAELLGSWHSADPSQSPFVMLMEREAECDTPVEVRSDG